MRAGAISGRISDFKRAGLMFVAVRSGFSFDANTLVPTSSDGRRLRTPTPRCFRICNRFSGRRAVVSVDVQPSRAIAKLRVPRSVTDGQKLTTKGINLGREGKIGAAIESLRRAVTQDAANVEAQYNLGVALLEKGIQKLRLLHL